MTPTVPSEILSKYDKPGPRYTSYPTAPTWSGDFGDAEHRASLQRASRDAQPMSQPTSQPMSQPMSMYVHLPFCRSMCFYCGCSVIISKDRAKGERYVGEVLQEAELARSAMRGSRPVVQHHWGGGTPTFLPPDQLERLFTGLTELFPVGEDAEVSIEVDPRVTTVEQLETLRRCGFNRISMGVQDFDPQVQETIHRVQSFEETEELVTAARELGYESVNLDLVYGLPHQTPDSFRRGIETVLELEPDRLACYGYAHVPWLKKHQRVIPEDALPAGPAKLELYLTALNAFTEAGYRSIGMDHFALPDDGLVAASEDGSLHRNFMGYTTAAAEDMLSFGITAISEMAGAFAQNVKTLKQYREHLAAGRLPVERGLRRDAEDEHRRRVILDLMCRFRLRYDDHGGAEEFTRRHADALERLRPMAEDGLVEMDGEGITVTGLGRLLVRNVAMPFDAYLERQRRADRPMFSRTV